MDARRMLKNCKAAGIDGVTGKSKKMDEACLQSGYYCIYNLFEIYVKIVSVCGD